MPKRYPEVLIIERQAMRALICEGGSNLHNLTVSSVQNPSPGPGQVVVQAQAASVDFVDTLIATGKYQIPVPTPFTPGNNVAGVVLDAAPDATRFKISERVHGMAFVGGFAELVAVHESQLRRTPEGLSAELACLTGTPYRTAYDVVVSTAKIKPGETVVVLGASGAVGSAVVLIAKARGARVVACASTDDKLAFCEQLGADAGVHYGGADFKDHLKEACAGSADVVIDLVGGEYSEPALRAVGYGGRFVVVGFAAGAPARVPLNLVLLKGSTITGYEIADFERMEPQLAAENRDALETMLVEGQISPPVTRRFRLEQAAEAMLHVSGRDKHGITILELA